MWQPQVAALSARFRMLTPDVRGFGESLPARRWAIEEMGEELREYMDRNHVDDCALAGLSMGGYIAISFAVKYPERVRQLILADTRARADNDAEKAARTQMIAALEQSGTGILPDRMLPRLLQPNPSPDVVRIVRSTIERTNLQSAIYALMAMRERPDASSILQRIECPTLVIVGEHDQVTRIDECRAMAETLPNGQFAQIPRAGHLSNLENPVEFNRALESFLD